jgi:hypothetical protein
MIELFDDFRDVLVELPSMSSSRTSLPTTVSSSSVFRRGRSTSSTTDMEILRSYQFREVKAPAAARNEK